MELAAVFEAIRAAAGYVPLRILSGYRTPAHNKTIGGAPNSQHVEGRALDIRPPAGWSVLRFYELCRSIPGVRGIGLYRTFVHVDIRPSTRQVAWNGGAKVKDDRA